MSSLPRVGDPSRRSPCPRFLATFGSRLRALKLLLGTLECLRDHEGVHIKQRLNRAFNALCEQESCYASVARPRSLTDDLPRPTQSASIAFVWAWCTLVAKMQVTSVISRCGHDDIRCRARRRTTVPDIIAEARSFLDSFLVLRIRHFEQFATSFHGFWLQGVLVSPATAGDVCGNISPSARAASSCGSFSG